MDPANANQPDPQTFPIVLSPDSRILGKVWGSLSSNANEVRGQQRISEKI
jgi:hypothetical protein